MAVKTKLGQRWDVKLGLHDCRDRWADWPLPASVRRVARPGKNCAWRQVGGQIQGRWLKGKGIVCGWQWYGHQGAEVRGTGDSTGSKIEQKGARWTWGSDCLPSALLNPSGYLQPFTNHAQSKCVLATLEALCLGIYSDKHKTWSSPPNL